MPGVAKRWTNFHVWKGKLPHWRADGVTYFVTFRHSRELDDDERRILFAHLLRPQARRWDLQVLCVLPKMTELIFTVRQAATGRPFELSDIVERAKKKAGKAIVKKTGERWPPFFNESFDRIIRDESEFKERWEAVVGAPCIEGLTQEPESYDTLFVHGHA